MKKPRLEGVSFESRLAVFHPSSATNDGLRTAVALASAADGDRLAAAGAEEEVVLQDSFVERFRHVGALTRSDHLLDRVDAFLAVLSRRRRRDRDDLPIGRFD